MIDMLQMGYVEEILFGREFKDRLPDMVKGWVAKIQARQKQAKVVLSDDTALF